MYKIRLLLVFFLFNLSFSYGQLNLTGLNVIVEYSPRFAYSTLPSNPSPSSVKTDLSYFDNLGRPYYRTQHMGSPNVGSDLISQYTTYDSFGRPDKDYLPSKIYSFNGNYLPSAVAATVTSDFYFDSYAYGQTTYENSKESRKLSYIGPGTNWHTNNRRVNFGYTIESIPKIILSGESLVSAGTLLVNKVSTTNEEGQRTYEYFNNQGQLLRREVELASNVFATTAYVYDDYDRLSGVIQPRYFELNSGTSFTISPNTEAYTESVFSYQYDHRGRLTRKHIPGYVSVTGTVNTGWEEYVYDKNNRLLFTQNPRQAESNKWSFVLYDVYGREVMRGERSLSGESRASLQTKVDAHTGNYFESRNTTSPLYYTTSNSLPTSIVALNVADVQSVMYYDSYADITTGGGTYQANSEFTETPITDVKGLLVGTKVKNNETTNDIRKFIYYNNTSDVIFTRSLESNATSFSSINVHDAWSSYTFTHQAIQTNNEYTWKANSGAALQTTTTREKYEYDQGDRLIKYYHGVNGPAKILASYQYDGIGRLAHKRIYDGLGSGNGDSYIVRTETPTQTQHTDQAEDYILYTSPTGGELLIQPQGNSYVSAVIGAGSGEKQQIDYAYHIRGGIKSITGQLFNLGLEYEENGGYYDGNIKKQTWLENSITRNYVYSYDLGSRLKTAIYGSTNPSIAENYSISSPISYDHNGNIGTMSRNGVTAGTIVAPTAFGQIDNLNYTYQNTYSNRLLKVTDGITSTMTGRGDFENTNGTSNDYTYYNDGSLKTDANKGITNILYNQFGTVEQVVKSGLTVSYVYDGDGTKLKKKTSTGNETLYVGALILEKNTSTGNLEIYQISHAEGRYTINGGYEFNYNDHLGNTRLVFNIQNGNATKIQLNAYDPWGLELKGINVDPTKPNNFKYNGKETQAETAWMDYGARMYDAQIGRWNVVDPLAEKREWLSGYNYVQNNPINRIDPDGAFDTKAEAKQYAEDNNIKTGFLRNNKIQKADDGSYAINNKKESTSISNDKDMGITTGALVTTPRIPDAEIISVGFDFAFLGGAGYSFQAVQINKGDDQGWHLYNTTNANIGFGVSAGVSYQQVDFNEKNDTKTPLNRNAFAGNGNAYTVGVGELGGTYGYALTNGKHSMNPKSKSKLYSTKGAGVSVGVDVGAMWQGSNSKLIGPPK